MYVVSHAKSFQISPKSVTKPTQIDPQVDPKSFPNRSRERLRALRRFQVLPQSAKRAPKSSLGAPQERPEAPQEPPGAPNRRPKRVPKRPEAAKKRSQVVLGSEEGDMARSSLAPHA